MPLVGVPHVEALGPRPEGAPKAELGVEVAPNAGAGWAVAGVPKALADVAGAPNAGPD